MNYTRKIGLVMGACLTLSGLQLAATEADFTVAEHGGGHAGGGHAGGSRAAESSYGHPHQDEGRYAPRSGDHSYERDGYHGSDTHFDEGTHFDRQDDSYRGFNREGWDRMQNNWQNGLDEVPVGEYVYPGTYPSTPPSSSSGDMDTLYDYENKHTPVPYGQ